jgi:hypothetical protein
VFGTRRHQLAVWWRVKVGAAVGRLLDKAAHRVSGDEAERQGDLADQPGPFLTVELEPARARLHASKRARTTHTSLIFRVSTCTSPSECNPKVATSVRQVDPG